MRHNKMLHDRVVLMTVRTAPVPHVLEDRRATIESIGYGIYSIRLVYRFMEDPHVPNALNTARRRARHRRRGHHLFPGARNHSCYRPTWDGEVA